MNAIQNAIVALVIGLCITVLASLAGAQDLKPVSVTVGVATLDVTIVPGHTQVCTRVTQTTLECLTLVKGKAPTTSTCEVTKGTLRCVGRE